MAEKKTPPPEEAGIISFDQASRLLKIGAERIKQLIRQGYIPKAKPGHVNMVGAVQGYIAFLQEAAKRNTKTAADQRVRDARAAEIEMRIAERKRELIPIEDAIAAMDLLAGKVKEEMTGLPARITRDLPLRRKIEAELNGAQSRIAEALRSSAEFARKGGELPYSGSADDA